MNIIFGPRKSGKTTKLIQISAETRVPMLVQCVREADRIKKAAVLTNLDIPSPLTYEEYLNTPIKHDVLIDDAELFIRHICGGDITAISINGEWKPVSRIHYAPWGVASIR